jgi:hypothetical protein
MEHFREKTTMFTGQLESMLLTCADATVRSVDFGTKFKEFSDTVLQLQSWKRVDSLAANGPTVRFNVCRTQLQYHSALVVQRQKKMTGDSRRN